MDQIKIGKLIAERRKRVGLTQCQLAQRLNITDRAVSKWETGRAMPDSSIMLELCEILEIGVNDLLRGEVVAVNDYQQESEERLLDMLRQKEQADKRLLTLEIFVGVTATVTLFVLIAVASLVTMADWLRVLLIAIAFVLFLAGCFCALRLEQVAGYYECRVCKHRHVPTYKAMQNAPHMGRKRYMRCPNCHQKSWQKKVVGDE
ncbi:MAG: helix-turn-helix domain-containing protein [Clostridia bacterium]|nr:helix-turn-helix domain-containing protein [Clostridia bacterium]